MHFRCFYEANWSHTFYVKIIFDKMFSSDLPAGNLNQMMNIRVYQSENVAQWQQIVIVNNLYRFYLWHAYVLKR